MGKSIIYTWPFSIAMLNYQRVFRRSPSPPTKSAPSCQLAEFLVRNERSFRVTATHNCLVLGVPMNPQNRSYFAIFRVKFIHCFGASNFLSHSHMALLMSNPPESDTLHLKLLPCWVHNFLLSELPEAFIWGWINIINSPKLDVLQKQLSLWLNSKINTGTHWRADQLR